MKLLLKSKNGAQDLQLLLKKVNKENMKQKRRSKVLLYGVEKTRKFHNREERHLTWETNKYFYGLIVIG